MNKVNQPENNESQDLLLARNFDAPRARLWKAWTDPRQLIRWWGPKDYTSPVSKIDLRVGGHYINSMQSNDGQIIWSTGVYREIHEPDRLVFTDSFGDENGNIVSPTNYGMADDFPEELLVEVTFEEKGEDKTRLTIRHIGLPAGQMRELTGIGWNESFDKLVEVLHT